MHLSPSCKLANQSQTYIGSLQIQKSRAKKKKTERRNKHKSKQEIQAALCNELCDQVSTINR